MARINVDNEFLCDPRLVTLADQMPRYQAIGCLVCLWEIGQAYWKKNKGLIPFAIFGKLPKHKELEAADFVVKKDDGIYCRGAEERWGFLLSSSIAGKASAAARKEKYGSAIPIHAQNSPKEHRATAERPPNGNSNLPNVAEHSSSSSSSFDLINHTKILRTKGRVVSAAARPPASEEGARISRFLKTYIDAWRLRYKTEKRPDVGGKVVGQVRLFLRDRPLEDACELVQAYCQMPDKWFETKYHDLITFLNNIPKVVVSLDKGRADPKVRTWMDIVDDNERKAKEKVNDTSRI